MKDNRRAPASHQAAATQRRAWSPLLKATCPNPECEFKEASQAGKPYTVRLTQQWADAGMPLFPCGTVMVLAGQQSEQLSEAA